jgi:hypothetical protein
MLKETKTEKGCGPQLLNDEQPSHSWDLDKLGEFAKEQHQKIVEGEKELAPAYWRLGEALDLARKQFNHGQWGKFLADLGIHKTRASKARAIFRSFQSLEDVAGQSVEDAYECRRSRQEQAPRAAKRKPKSKGNALKAFLKHVPKEAKALIDEAVTMRPPEASQLMTAIDAAIENLQRLRETLAAKATVATAAGSKKRSR